MNMRRTTNCWVCSILLAAGTAQGSIIQIHSPLAETTIWVNANSAATNPDGTLSNAYPAIQQGLDAAAPGQAVVVKAGTYREQLNLPSGTPSHPITLTAAPSEYVQVSGMSPLTGWQPQGPTTWNTTCATDIERLYRSMDQQPLARAPNQGWWTATSVNNSAGNGMVSLTDTNYLFGFPHDLSNASVFVWAQQGNQFFTCSIVSLDPTTGELIFQKVKSAMQLTAGDRYWLQNHPSLITKPGEWAVQPDGEHYRVSWWPTDTNDLEQAQAPTATQPILRGTDVRHLRVGDLDIVGSTSSGIRITSGTDLRIDHCRIRDNQDRGLDLRSFQQGTVTRCVVSNNRNGIHFTGVTGGLIEACDIGNNLEDGLVVSHNSSDVTVRRNYLHDHQLWAHPDNAQLYRTVTGLRFIENLLISAGQSMMMEESSAGEFIGNVFLGSAGNMLVFGHGNAIDYTVRGNTFAYAGYGCLNLTGRDYVVENNIFLNGHNFQLYSVAGVSGYTANSNVFWNGPRLSGARLLTSDAGQHTDLAGFQTATGQDGDSVHADPAFINAPIGFGVLDESKLSQSTSATFYLRSTDTFQIGDHIEINFDGTPRTIISAQGGAITVQPPLDELPLKGWLVANWGSNTNFTIDTRLQPGSPATSLGAGASFSISAYRSGDFDGDGQRDLP